MALPTQGTVDLRRHTAACNRRVSNLIATFYRTASALLIVVAALLSKPTLVSPQLLSVIDSSCTGHGVIVSNARQRGGANCSSGISGDIALHVNAALVKDILQRSFNSTCQAEVCQSINRIASMHRQRWATNTVYLNVDKEDQLEFLLQFRAVHDAPAASSGQPILSTVPSHLDASATGADAALFLTNYETSFSQLVYTPGPSVYDLAEMAYRFIIDQGWTYIAVVTSSNRGDQLLISRLQELARSGDNRLCLGLIVTLASGNATSVAQRLRSHVYDDKKLARLTVLVTASFEIGAQLLDLAAAGGTDASAADSGRRYQWVLVGELGRYVGLQLQRAGNNTMLGTVIIQSGVLDNVTADPVASLVLNASLKFLSPNFNSCVWTDLGSPCYASALAYDYLLLSLLPLVSQAPGSWTNASLLSVLRSGSLGELALSTFAASLPYYRVFTDQGYVRYSFSRGLYHSTRGYSAPAVKVYNAQLVDGAQRLVKIGEMIIDRNAAGQAKRTMSLGPAKYYVFNATSGTTTQMTRTASQCFGVCPECVPDWSAIVEFSPGDYYIGVIAPIRSANVDKLYCTDGTLAEARDSGYQFSLAVKFIIQAVNYLGNVSAVPQPLGFNQSLMDQQFLGTVSSLLADVARARGGKSPTLGYAIIDSCFLGSHTFKNVNLLLTGKLSNYTPGLSYANVLGFIGALSSTCTMAASEVLKQYGLPLISYGSTATVLNDTTQYPFVARTIVTDRVIAHSMVTLLRDLQVDYMAAVYANTDYGRSLLSQLLNLAANVNICVRGAFAHTIDDAVSSLNLLRKVAALGVRYVAFLGSLADLTNFLGSSGAEGAAAAITFVTTEAVATSTAWMSGRPLLGAGSLGVSIGVSSADQAAAAAFASHERSLLASPPADTARPWHTWQAAFYESARRCYLATEFTRSTAYSQSCRAVSASEVDLSFADSRVPLAMNAASSLILGGLTAVKRICIGSSSNSSDCDGRVQNASYEAMLQRGNLVLFGSNEGGPQAKPQAFGDYRRIYDDRLGQNLLLLWQYRNDSATGWGYVLIGSFVNGSLRMLASRDKIQAGERQAAQTACSDKHSCRYAATLACVNLGTTTAGPEVVSSDNKLLALICLLLTLPLGSLAGWGIWKVYTRRRAAAAAEAAAFSRQQDLNPVGDVVSETSGMPSPGLASTGGGDLQMRQLPPLPLPQPPQQPQPQPQPLLQPQPQPFLPPLRRQPMANGSAAGDAGRTDANAVSDHYSAVYEEMQ